MIISKFENMCAQLRESVRSDRPNEESATVARRAAVALILREHAGAAEILMIKRADNPRDYWSGHLALPGGRWQIEDETMIATAVRETKEEVGLDLSVGGTILGPLEVVAPRSKGVPSIVITPVLAIAPSQYHSRAREAAPPTGELRLNHEVAAAFWLSVADLVKSGRSDRVRYVFEGHDYNLPAYPSTHGPIWGLTERILTGFLSLISAGDSGL